METLIKGTGRKSVVRGMKYVRGFVVRPEQMIQLLRDIRPDAPIPPDAQVIGLGIEEKGRESRIRLYYHSLVNPLENCLEMHPHTLFQHLKGVAEGIIPADGELDGIEISTRFTVLMLRVKSEHFPPWVGDAMPVMQLRYEWGTLFLFDPASIIEERREQRIKVTDNFIA